MGTEAAAGAKTLPGGLLVTFEGVEGAGKSTQLSKLAARLLGEEVAVAPLHEPGSTLVGDHLRELLLKAVDVPLLGVAELFLYLAARAQLVNEAIKVALAAGRVVLCDRFVDSTAAYQGYGRGLDLSLIERLNRLAVDGIWPSLTVLLDLDPSVGLARSTAGRQDRDRFERESLAFHQRVREGYLALARAEPNRFLVLDAAQDPAAIADAVWKAVNPHLRRAVAPAPAG